MSVDDAYGISTLFGFLGKVFYEEPDAAFIGGLASQRDLLAEPPFSSVAPSGSSLLADALEAYSSAPDAAFAEIWQDHTFLFTMAGNGKTSPFESVYRTDDRTLFGPTTADVARRYAIWGFEGACRDNEPADHFGLECAFAAHLAAQAAAYDEAGKFDLAQAAFIELRTMLDDHLLVYGECYLEAFAACAQTDFYRSCAQIAKEALAAAGKRSQR